MSDTNVQDCNCCEVETDCINGLCEPCSDYNYKLQKQADLLTLGLLQEKNRVAVLEKKLKDMASNHNEHTGRMYEMAHKARIEGLKEGLSEYAWWKDVVQYVGTCGTTLKQALKENGIDLEKETQK